jgi:hypothetical protein
VLPFIHTAATFYGAGENLVCPDGERCLALHPPRHLPLVAAELTARGTRANSVTTTAYVDHGRWVARCPFCPSAQVVSASDPWFICAGEDGCLNLPVAGASARIVFPGPLVRAAIEQALLRRPQLHNRNWNPRETVADLLAENAVNGL